jgi:hypothetical protein
MVFEFLHEGILILILFQFDGIICSDYCSIHLADMELAHVELLFVHDGLLVNALGLLYDLGVMLGCGIETGFDAPLKHITLGLNNCIENWFSHADFLFNREI